VVTKAKGKPTTVEDLIFEISEIHSCQILLSWDELVGSGEIDKAEGLISRALNNPDQISTYQPRQLLAHAMAEVGFRGIPAIKPRVIKMIEELDPSVHHVRTGLPFLNSSEVSDAPGEWRISADAVNKIRKELITDRQREIIERKATEGRYTLEEAADLISESMIFDCAEEDFESCDGMSEPDERDELALLDKLDEPDELDNLFKIDGKEGGDDDIECSEILNKLSTAARSGKLPTYWPGSDKRFSYDQRVNTEVRVFFEEAYWRDLNKWLDKYCTGIDFRFLDPSDTEENRKNKGVTKCELVYVDWPMPEGRELKKILDAEPDWILSALVSRGRPGGGRYGSHRWNPAQIAICLHTRWPKKSTVSRLTKVMERSYEKYFNQWNDYLETQRNPGGDSGSSK